MYQSESVNHKRSCEILTFIDVVPVNSDILVTVAPGVFMVETQRVQQLVLDDAVMYAAKPLQ